MIKNIIIILLLLLSSFPSLGNVNGKGIVCKCVDCKLEHIDPSSYISKKKPSEIGFHFKNNKVTIYFISKFGDKIKLSENIDITLRKKKKFYTDDNIIKWTYKDSLNIYAYVLERSSLKLSKKNITNTETYNIRMCDVFSEIDFFEKMNKLSSQYQKNHSSVYNKNKI